MFVNGTKSNSNLDAFLEFIGNPVAANIIASKSLSPTQAWIPSPKTVLFGPGAFNALPVVKTIPSWNGNDEPFLLK